ncbi:O-methylsterigmatocystin oxidoreductase [Polyporus arcularius HHB13444]|uniref:O-methylsterigmatocystin oxidoreductase n=1 Tax=Polyporus arcularius HHB13444 TaxID=1314778 RepID=A0A5C3PRR5_9APHY|nr:O-methylsterigmatocystin oxidoreductase [Polyporus arcularius HHB13444]
MHAEHSLRADVLVAALLLVSLLVTRSLLRSKSWNARMRGRALPPGPRGMPFIGNLFSMPQSKAWYGFRDLALKYGAPGDVTYFQVMGRHVMVLGSPTSISEFLEKRTSNTSDRLVTPLIRLTGLDWILGLVPYGPLWRAYRRALWQHFHPGVLPRYQTVQNAITRKFLLKLMHKPEDFRQHVRFVLAATLLKVVYGIDVEDENHEIVRMIDVALEGPAQAFVPGKFLVDVFPLLQYVPEWLPGANFQKMFAKWRKANLQMKEILFKTRNTAFTENSLPGSMPIVDALLLRFSNGLADPSLNYEMLVENVAAVTFEAGTDTTYSTVLGSFVALSLYPAAQKKAQAELDAVVGRERLPELHDRESLVYVKAIIMESLRWHNVTPLGIAHRTILDDEIQGYFVPAGTTLVANIWACMHDSTEYPDPADFRPERFIHDGKIDTTVRDPFTVVFGSGRRYERSSYTICPGRYFANDSLFLIIASVLHMFDIGPPVDDHGQMIKVEPWMTDGFLSYLEDTRCTIRPRSSDMELSRMLE